MKISNLWKLILCGIAVLILSSCNKTKEPDNGNATRTAPDKVGVSITDCEPLHDPIKLKKGGTVDWTATDADYTITFEPKKYPGTNNPITVPGPLTLHQNVLTSQKLDLPADCTPKKGCYYKYDITKVPDQNPCYDPGIHIVPSS